MYAIETVSLTKRYRRVEAVRDLNLQVVEGAVYALMGPNGAGKSTLIKILMNLIGPTEGRARMLGRDVESLRGRRLEQIGYVSENQKLPEWMTVGSYLSYWRPFYPTWDKALELRLVKQFELPLGQKLKRLSRGMRMKTALASALAFHPRLVVLDEPLSGLDPLVRDDLMASLLETKQETTVLLSSHDLAEIDSFASHVGYMDRGQLWISESMAGVKQRFRRVEVCGVQPVSRPASLPAEWRNFSANDASATWTETSFDYERAAAQARELFGDVQLTSSPLTLREVFLAMARRIRPQAAEEGRP